MNRKIISTMIIIAFLLSIFGLSSIPTGASPGVVYTDTQDVYLYSVGGTIGWTHYYDGSAGIIESASITIVADDVDGERIDPYLDGEQDEVYFNGHYLGLLNDMGYYTDFNYQPGPGNDDQPLTSTTFDIDPAWILPSMPCLVYVESAWGVEIETSTLKVEGHHVTIEKTLLDSWYFDDSVEIHPNPIYYVPYQTEVFFEMMITVDNPDDDYDIDIPMLMIEDGISAKLDLVILTDTTGDYIFWDDSGPLYFDDDETEYFGETGPVSWEMANGKEPKNGQHSATILSWYVEDLVDGDAANLWFTVKTVGFSVGKDGKNSKQSFTSTCHHELNDGPVVYYDYDDDEIWDDMVMGEPLIVSVYNPEPGADSDGDGIEDWYEVEVYGSDPCGANIFVGGFNTDRSRGSLGYSSPSDEWLKDALDDPDNFGSMGIVPCTIVYAPFVNEIFEESLVDEDGNLMVHFFFAGLSYSEIAEYETIELERFLDAGGILYICGNSDPLEGQRYNPLFTELGWTDSFTSDVISSGTYSVTTTPVTTPVTSGPFGTIGPLTHTPFSAFNPVTAVNVATGYDPSATPRCIIAEGSYGSNGGYISIMGDPLYFDLFNTDEDNINYFLNLFALAAP